MTPFLGEPFAEVSSASPGDVDAAVNAAAAAWESWRRVSGAHRGELVAPNTWGDEPVHPFAAKFFEPSENVSLNRIFEHGLRFEPSHEHAGLQLVDVVAYVMRRAILEPDNDVIHRAYAHLRGNLRTERDGQALRLVSGGGGREREIDDYRYRRVLWVTFVPQWRGQR